MPAPTTVPDPLKEPLCPTCVMPMALVRIVAAVPESELRIFACRNCGIVMFTEIS